MKLHVCFHSSLLYVTSLSVLSEDSSATCATCASHRPNVFCKGDMTAENNKRMNAATISIERFFVIICQVSYCSPSMISEQNWANHSRFLELETRNNISVIHLMTINLCIKLNIIPRHTMTTKSTSLINCKNWSNIWPSVVTHVLLKK